MRIDEEPVVVEQNFTASVETVWKAITDVDQMHQWYFDNIPAFKAEVGFETEFNIQSQDRNFLHKWKVTEVVSRNKITYDWRYENYPGDGLVTFELFEQENGTKLRLTNLVVEDFPDDIPEFRRESCVAGWQFFIQQRLKDFLEKTE